MDTEFPNDDEHSRSQKGKVILKRLIRTEENIYNKTMANTSSQSVNSPCKYNQRSLLKSRTTSAHSSTEKCLSFSTNKEQRTKGTENHLNSNPNIEDIGKYDTDSGNTFNCDTEQMNNSLPDPLKLQFGLEETLGMAEFIPLVDEENSSGSGVNESKKNTKVTLGNNQSLRTASREYTVKERTCSKAGPVKKHTFCNSDKSVAACRFPHSGTTNGKGKKSEKITESEKDAENTDDHFLGIPTPRPKKKSIVKPNKHSKVLKSDEELLAECYKEIMRRWRAYIRTDRSQIWLEELNNALEYAYNEEALDMICFRETSVWEIIEDLTCGPSHL